MTVPADLDEPSCDWRHHVPLLRRVFAEVRPAFGLELGVCTGRSLELFSCLAPDCFWLGVDRWEEPGTGDRWTAAQDEAVRRLSGHRAALWRADYHAVAKDLAGVRWDVVHVDGDHDYDSVRRDYALALDLVRVGGAVLLHDVDHPHTAVRSFWERDVLPEERTSYSPSDCGLGVVWL